MDTQSLRRRLLLHGCRLVARRGPFIVVERAGRRAVIPQHRGEVPRIVVARVAAYLDLDLR